MIRRTGTFTAYDSSGRVYTIGVFQESADTVTSAGGHISPEEKRLATADGLHVNWKGKGRYEIVGGDENVTVTSDDPHAP
jgi:hypothetical protein